MDVTQLAQILEHLDCEGLRKLSAVCKSLRARSFRQLALAEFTPKSVMLTGLSRLHPEIWPIFPFQLFLPV